MTSEDIQLIEHELALTLPESYKQSLVPFRIPAMAGNDDTRLWDDAQRLVALNKELRAGDHNRPAWPGHLFAVGDPHGDEIIAIDTRSPAGPVWWLDHGLVNSKSSYQSHASFGEWVDEFYRDLRSDLEGDGYNAEGSPEDFKTAQNKEAKQNCISCLLVIFTILLAIFIFRHFFR